jgi:hypothetical protein
LTPEPNEWIFPAFTDHDQYDRVMEKFSDPHICTSSKCNRQCDFYIVSGRPDGWYGPITEETLERNSFGLHGSMSELSRADVTSRGAWPPARDLPPAPLPQWPVWFFRSNAEVFQIF